jgi:hypothetical protein
MTYQWRKDGADIAGAASAAYTKNGAAPTDSGEYRARVTYAGLTFDTAPITVTVTPAPPLITSAASADVARGAGGTFQVTATGTAPITYSLDGAVPAGVTIDSASGLITIDAAAAEGEHTFTITASNGASPDAAQEFTLRVISAPTPVAAMKLWVMRARYDGGSHTPAFALIDPAARKMLISGTDYDVTGGEARTEAGNYPVTVTGKDEYSGSKTSYFVISKRPENADIAASASSLASAVNGGGFGLHAAASGGVVTITNGGGSAASVMSAPPGELELDTVPGVTIIWKASLTGSSPYSLVSVNGGGDIKISGGSIINDADGGVALYCEGSASMDGGVVSANGYAASAVDAGGKFTFSGGVITAGGKYGIGIFAVHGITITGGEVSAGQSGAAVLSLSDLNFTGGGNGSDSASNGGGGCDAGASGILAALFAAAMINRKKN